MTTEPGLLAGGPPARAVGERLPARADGRATLSICVICQDSAAWMPRLLEQCSQMADEILLVDGGSADATASIAARFPLVRLLMRPWDGNHCSQRNFGWRHARGEWILFLDTDELLSWPLQRLLPRLLGSSFVTIGFPRYWLVAAEPPRYLADKPHHPDRQYRLFRNRPGLRWDESRPIHGQVGPPEARGPVFKVRHAPLLHLVLLANARREREARVAHYESARDDGRTANRRFYVHEDGNGRVRRLRHGRIRLVTDRMRLWWRSRS